MSWLSNALSSSIGRKIIMSITGLFLCSFLVIHLIGNLQLFKNDGGVAFNIYSHFMGTNPVIRTIEFVLLAGFVFHIYEAIALTGRNKAARGPQGYKVDNIGQNSPWQSRNMGLLGTIILIFLLVHLYNFFYRARFGDLDPDINSNDDLYTLVASSFKQWWYVLLYVLAQVALAYHLIHGFKSAFQTLGLTHRKYTPFITYFGYAFSIIVCAGFAAMPLYFFFLK
ncbi:succinate dehydrogenase cytochrome b subunit [Hymenobacter busanensis]|uniref:Succinate dehydrogenase cytochrome b subunit n=1 Tax=Hymenobacter busanensis TaxID=2607656 RepID=A0A7L4ZW79_9BACT|nr:succinate dehydrogenase cytochrome b subunit [Hymenobacter busanensis]KAA9339122.1 succinate dehydrogenase cytochrome b subunit [Hymenobacter busanensis]QHJ07116.1 succinate dehydrogenase [Hymenobacter busanensis]